VGICEQTYAPWIPKVEKFLPSNRRDFVKSGKILHISAERDSIAVSNKLNIQEKKEIVYFGIYFAN
jgi:hypothetical protein